jgi:outer membrane receptor protein involved in Fe transport
LYLRNHKRLTLATIAAALLLFSTSSFATVFGNVRGVVHDPQHRPLSGAKVTLKATLSDFALTSETNADGFFEFTAVQLGAYNVTIESSGFAPQTQELLLASGGAPVLHYQLAIAPTQEQVSVTAPPADLNPDSPQRTLFVNQNQISNYAGVDSSTSFKIITEFVPSSYIVHDQLHVRGGHQVTWALDGVPIPNTNIASNVGPQFNPKDVQYLEAQSGSYSAEYGDRTYGVFNVASKTGFDRDRVAELVLSYGNYNSTDNQISFGDHTEKFAYYASASGNYSEYGLEPPTLFNLHNQGSGGGGFVSLLYNPHPSDQLRFNAGVRLDNYEVPNDPDMQAAGIDDHEKERDAFATFTWVHTFSPGLMLSISPFYHYNKAAYEGGPADVPITTDRRTSNYEGGQVSLRAVKGRNNAVAGIYAFAQQDNSYISLVANDGSGDAVTQSLSPTGSLTALFAEDQFKATSWLTLTAGLRYTHFAGIISEDAVDPRLGVAIKIPRINWVLRAAYSRYYQAPPLDTVSGPLLEFAASQGVSFLPLKGERDEQYEYGLTIPLFNWVTDLTYFRTAARNFFDHDALGNSNLFFPLTIQSAGIQGFEVAMRSPLLAHRYNAHLVYSNMEVVGYGGVTGGMTDFSPPPVGGYYLDHDQRNTLSAGIEGKLPWHTFGSFTYNYGSGFLEGDGPAHLPPHSTFDVSLGKSFGEYFSVRFIGTNIINTRYMLDTSNTFGGTHFADPMMVSVQVRYRFHY